MAGNTNKPENYLEGGLPEWGSMRFSPPSNWNVKPNREWFGLVGLINCLDISDGHMIEVGTYAGESTSMFASSGKFKKIHTIDPYFYGCGHEVFMEAKVNCRYWDYIEFHRDYSQNISNKFMNGVFDLVYLDGDHRGEAVAQDLDLYWPKVKPGGYMGGHDYNPEYWPEVHKAVNKKFGGKMMQTFDDKSWLIRK